LNPDLLSLVGVTTTRPAGAVELRGFYGGLELGMAVFFALSVGRRGWHVPALLVQVLSLGGAVVGRLVGIAVDGGAEPLIFALLAAESGATAFGAIALRAALAHAQTLTMSGRE
jgi:hypothetical protein